MCLTLWVRNMDSMNNNLPSILKLSECVEALDLERLLFVVDDDDARARDLRRLSDLLYLLKPFEGLEWDLERDLWRLR